jgi:hypothetical protein
MDLLHYTRLVSLHFNFEVRFHISLFDLFYEAIDLCMCCVSIEAELLALKSEETLLPALTAPLRLDAQTLMQRASLITITDKTLLTAMSTCDPSSASE